MDARRSEQRRTGAGAAALAGLALVAGAALSGCAALEPLTDQVKAGAHELAEASNLTPLGVNPSSPIAADALKAEAVDGPIPSFATVPPRPGDVRGAPAYKTEVVQLVSTKRSLNRWDAANPPGVVDAAASERYAEAQRDRVGHEAPVGAEKKNDTEAFAHKERAAVGQPEPPSPARSPN